MKSIKIGLLGCGTVGTGVLRVIHDNATDIEARLGVPLEVVCIAVHDKDKKRDPSVPTRLLTDRAGDVLDDPNVQIIVEVMGGLEPARSHLLEAIAKGKHVVTANKALLATHGAEIFRNAVDHRRDVIFEASVGGGIPVIRMLREGLAAERVQSIHAIINGTSNYILTAMSQKGLSYADALAQAQELGYAEADPTMDVGGHDAAQKLSILVALSFGTQLSHETFLVEGVASLTSRDIHYAHQFGYVIKPLAIAKIHGDGIEARVHPALLPRKGMLGSVDGVFNTVMVESSTLGPVLMYGQGAGMLPTASAVVADVIELGRNVLHGVSCRLPHLAFHPNLLPKRSLKDAANIRTTYYLRFPVRDEPVVLASLNGILGKHGISISRMVQELDTNEGAAAEDPQVVQVVMLTHQASEGDVQNALIAIRALPCMLGQPQMLRVEG